MSVLINGDFLVRPLTGIERFSYETCIRLDKIITEGEVSILIPKNARFIPNFKRIRIIKSIHPCKVFPLWLNGPYVRYAISHKMTTLDFSNVTPFMRGGIVFIHDIYAKLFPQDFTTFKDKLRRLYMCAMYKNAAKYAKTLVTVSNFSRKQISETYNIEEKNIQLIYNGWEHFKDIKEDKEIFNKFPSLKGNFFFTLGSLQKRKNLKWLSLYAEKHPEDTFAISGKAISGFVSDDIKKLQTLSNVVLLGYVTDEEVKALMSKCEAFIFPSYYEGFGIPPLEALSCGARIIISDAACLKELYGDCALYINPDNTNCDLHEMLKHKTQKPDELLEKYSYEMAAKKLYNIIRQS